MEKIKICKGINVSKKIFTKTWQDLEGFFGVPLTEFGKVMEKKTKDLKNQIEFMYIVVSQENDISKEELIKKIDNDDDLNVTILNAIKSVINIFTSGMGTETGEGKNSGN